MAKKTVAISEEAYAFLKARADNKGMTMREIVDAIVTAERVTQPKQQVTSDEQEQLPPEKIDEAQGYERKPGEVTLRDGLGGFYSLSYGSKDMGRDDS